MIIKNIKYNIKNYTAYLLGNSLIGCILFMFFTLVFSPEFMNADKTMPLKGNFLPILVIMVAFSGVFIIYTTVSFTKYRGRELGVYFTIGLTSREIIKILFYENIIISISAFLFGSILGSIFSKLFHMAIGEILNINNISIPLSIKAYGVIALISIGTLLFTTIYQIIFLKRYSVINILKSKSKKDIGSTSSISYGMYKSTEKLNSAKYPYDISFVVEKENLQNVDLKQLVEESTGEIESYGELEGINLPDIKVGDGVRAMYDVQTLNISENTYNKIYNKDLSLDNGEVMLVDSEKTGRSLGAGFILDFSGEVSGNMNEEVSLDEYKKQHDSNKYFYIPNENRKDEVSSIINCLINNDYTRFSVLVDNDQDYEVMKKSIGNKAITYDILVNLKNSKPYESYSEILKAKLEQTLGIKVSNSLTIKEKELNSSLEENGFTLFTFSFMGLMFLLGSSAVIYFKTITSIEGDRERAKQLVKIGLTKKEINSLSTKELAAIFLVPPIIAIACIGYYLSSLYQLISGGEDMWNNSLVVFAVYFVIQIIFFIITSKKYKKQINNIF